MLFTISVLAFSTTSFLYIVKNIYELSSFINSTGVIRGGIQRFVNVSLLERATPEDVLIVERNVELLHSFMSDNIRIFNTNDFESYDALVTEWVELKIVLIENIEKNTEQIYLTSEEIWKQSNNLVNIIEIKAHRYIAFQYFLSFLLFASICILFVVVFFIRKTIQGSIEKKASHDPLTNLLNRNYLPQIYNFKMLNNKNDSSHLAVLMCDIDHFKNVNDTFGHDVGDLVLKEIAALLLTNTRENDAVFRYGGEEFLILISFQETTSLLQYAERLRASIESAKIIERQITISIGISFIDELEGLKQSILHADTALYSAKQQGRNRVVVYEKTTQGN